MKGEQDKSRLEPTPLPNEQYKDDTREASNLSDRELQERIENRSRIGYEQQNFITQQKMLQEYRNEKQQREQNHIKAEINHALGDQTRLHQKSIETHRNDKEYVEQQIRNQLDSKSKEQYNQDNSPQIEFRKKSLPSDVRLAFIKNRDIERDR